MDRPDMIHTNNNGTNDKKGMVLKMKKRSTFAKIMIFALAVVTVILTLLAILCGLNGCSEADIANSNISKQSGYFECERRVTVYNARTDPEEIQQMRQPAADMQEVRRGKWRQVFKGALHDCFECSACGHKDCEYTLNYHYCPHCGAKMEGDEK